MTRTVTLRTLWAAAAACVLLWTPSLQSAAAADLLGHDISWPQCSAAQGGGQPMPPTSTQFVIVGLTRGLAFTENPCLAEQVAWVNSNAKPAHAYAMATFPTAAQLTSYGSSGPYNAGTRAGQLANVGHAEAKYALASLDKVGWHPPVVWIDVEPRPAQPWPGTTAAQKVENRYVVQGLVRALRDAGVGYGFYSYANGWQEIAGAWSVPGVPVWATAGRLDYPEEALDRCTQASFSGGKVFLSQWYDDTRDYDRTCGSYAFGDLPRNLTGASGVQVSASSVDTAVSPTAARAVDGVASGYPVDSSLEWSSLRQKAGAWIELRWPSAVSLDRVVLHDRPNTDDQVLGGTLTFSDGSSVAVGALANDGAALNVSFAARTVTWVRFTVTSASAATWSAGLSEFEAWGVPAAVAPTGTNVARASGVGVTASSQNTSTGQTAAKAVDGSADGYPGDHTREWSTVRGKSGSWLQLTWPGAVTLNRVVLFDRPNTSDNITSATLTFSDGSTVAVPALAANGAATSVTFAARTTTSLRLTVTGVSGTTSNIGLAELEAWGTSAGTNVARASGVGVTASSQNTSTGQTAVKAVDGSADGYPGDHTREWSTVGGKAGSWLQLTWPSAVTLNRVVLFDRPNSSDNVTSATLTFSDGSTVSVPAPAANGGATTVTFSARSTTSLRLTITGVSGTTANIGLAELEVWSAG